MLHLTHRSDIEKMQDQLLILAEDFSIGDDVKQGVSNLTSSSGDDDTNWFRLKIA